jgi:hypothetical protein
MNRFTVRRRMQQQLLAAKTKAQQQSKKQEEEWDVMVAYLAAAILAIVFTLTCPGHTDLWLTLTTVSTATASESSSSSTAAVVSKLNWLLFSLAVVS